MDETWIYHHDPKLKQERLQWIEAGSSAPKQVKSERSAKKVMHCKKCHASYKTVHSSNVWLRHEMRLVFRHVSKIDSDAS